MIPTITSPRSNPGLPVDPISILPEEIITCVASCFISAVSTDRYAEAYKIGVEFRARPKPKNISIERKRKRLLTLKCLMEDRLSWFKTDLRIVRSPWKDLASFALTCKRVHGIVHSKIYSKPAILEKINLAEERFWALRFLLTTGKEKVAAIASKIKDLQPFNFVLFGIEFSIEYHLLYMMEHARFFK